MRIHVYQLHTEGPAQEDLEEEGDLAAASHWLLPATPFHGLWDSLVFDADIKTGVNRSLYYSSLSVTVSNNCFPSPYDTRGNPA